MSRLSYQGLFAGSCNWRTLDFHGLSRLARRYPAYPSGCYRRRCTPQGADSSPQSGATVIGRWRFDHTGLQTKQQNFNTHVVAKCVTQIRQGVLTTHARVRKHFVCGHLSTAVNGVPWEATSGLRYDAESQWKAEMVHKGDGTAACEGIRSNGLIQLEHWQTPDADHLSHHFVVEFAEFPQTKIAVESSVCALSGMRGQSAGWKPQRATARVTSGQRGRKRGYDSAIFVCGNSAKAHRVRRDDARRRVFRLDEQT